MAAVLTFAGSVLMSDGEGQMTGWVPGEASKRVRSYTPLMRGLGVRAKLLGSEGTTHSVTLVYVTTASLTIATVQARIAAACAASGSLVVAGWGTLPRCVLDDATMEQPAARKTLSGTAAIEVTYHLTFRQTS